jgi:hypothetical protein
MDLRQLLQVVVGIRQAQNRTQLVNLTMRPGSLAITARDPIMAPCGGSVSACASWRIPVVMGYAPGCFRGMKRDAVPGMSINGGQASV